MLFGLPIVVILLTQIRPNYGYDFFEIVVLPPGFQYTVKVRIKKFLQKKFLQFWHINLTFCYKTKEKIHWKNPLNPILLVMKIRNIKRYSELKNDKPFEEVKNWLSFKTPQSQNATKWKNSLNTICSVLRKRQKFQIKSFPSVIRSF